MSNHPVREELVHWLALTLLPSLGPAAINRIAESLDDPALLFSPAPPLTRLHSLTAKQRQTLASQPLLQEAQDKAADELANLARFGIQAMSRADPGYPRLLLSTPDPPPVLFYKGDPVIFHRPSLAIIGSRAATSYGRRVAFELARDLAARGIPIVSGMALGIDGEAHRGALAGKGLTAGVLGCGLDVVYPRQHDSLYEEVAAAGILLSEYPPGTPPDGFRFPARNRIIAGLCSGVVVVEASSRSGSLITAELAMELGREVFAVPGRIDSSKSAGCHRLLAEGAHLALSAQGIMEELGLKTAFPPQAPGRSDQHPDGNALSGEMETLFACLEIYPQTVDQLVRRSQLDAARVHNLLLHLELLDQVRQLPGQQYEKTC